MSVNENGNPRPDGFSLTAPFIGWGGTYYWNPGAPTAPAITLTRSLGLGGGGAHAVFLRKGITSQDTLGYGTNVDISTLVPSVAVNTSIPDENGIPQPWKAKVSSIEAGVGIPGVGATYTATPQQLAERILKYIISPAMSPGYNASPSALSFENGVGTVGKPSEAPVRFLSRREVDPLGNSMGGWTRSVPNGNWASTGFTGKDANENSGGMNVGPSNDAPPFIAGASAIPFLPAPQNALGGLPGMIASVSGNDFQNVDQPPSGGLAGLIQEYLRANPERGR